MPIFYEKKRIGKLASVGDECLLFMGQAILVQEQARIEHPIKPMSDAMMCDSLHSQGCMIKVTYVVCLNLCDIHELLHLRQ